MTITAKQLLQLVEKVEKLGYSWDFTESMFDGYLVRINRWDKKKSQKFLYIYDNSDVSAFDDLMEDLDIKLQRKQKEEKEKKQERFKLYQELQKEFGNN